MYLYHGTTAKTLDAIMREGIKPRAKTKAKSNWKHTIESNKDSVYLTTAYPWHFAGAAGEGTKEKGLILEIDADYLWPWLLCPDEDFLEQSTRNIAPSEGRENYAPIEWGMKKRTRFYRKIARYNPKLAALSLEHMGTAGYYGTINWSLVTRYVIIDWSVMDLSMKWQALDSMVSCLNYQILEDRHKAFVRWFFGDKVTPEELAGWAHDEVVDPAPEVSKTFQMMKARLEHLARMIEERAGLTVVVTNNVPKPLS